MTTVDIVVIGAIIKETIVYSDRVIGPVIGSPAAYSSLAMAAQGKNVGLVTYYGNDLGELFKEFEPINTKGVLTHTHTTTNRLFYREDGTKWVEYMKKAPVLYFDDIHEDFLMCKFFKICPMDYEVDPELVRRIHDMGKMVFVDLGGYGGATSSKRHSILTEKGRNIIGSLCRSCSIIKASHEDLASIFPNLSTEDAAIFMYNAGCPNVVVTIGRDGSFYLKNGTPVYFPALNAVNGIPQSLLDFTGAGDSFGAGFMASYSEFSDIEKAIVNGNSTASLVIEKTGGCTFSRMPDKSEVEARIKGK